MADQSCTQFLQWALPQLGMRWKGFRRVRRQVCRRIRGRMTALGLEDHHAYRMHLAQHAEEWPVLDTLCRVTISRFYRNRRLYEGLPELAQQLQARAPGRSLRVWSAGCASGEEPYSVALALRHLRPAIEIVATDADPHMVERAQRGVYPRGTLRELDDATIAEAFEESSDGFALRAAIREPIRFLCQDVRRQTPDGPFDLILCRNLAFTYFDAATQRAVVQHFARSSPLGGALVVGAHEALPTDVATYEAWPEHAYTYRRVAPAR